jgi:GT2 family glycosyltransferase
VKRATTWRALNYDTDNPLNVSVVVPTRDRPKDLADLLSTLLDQTCPPFEVIIVDGSPSGSAKEIVASSSLSFRRIRSELRYIEGKGKGLPAARNIGISVSKGDVVLFLDDDTLMEPNVLETLAAFLGDNPTVMGVQPRIVTPFENLNSCWKSIENATYKACMMDFCEKNTLAVRRSGRSISPNELSKVICARRLSGCSMAWRREIFRQQLFDTRLERWGFMEDLDFSYRAYKKNPKSLFATPETRVFHKASKEARLATKTGTYMSIIYWFYVFFKDFFEASILNLIAFLWALVGRAATTVVGLVVNRRAKVEWLGLINLLGAYVLAFRNLKFIRRGKLEFFNKNL